MCCHAAEGTGRLQLAMLGSHRFVFHVFLVMIIKSVTLYVSISNHKQIVELAFVVVMLHIEKSTN